MGMRLHVCMCACLCVYGCMYLSAFSAQGLVVHHREGGIGHWVSAFLEGDKKEVIRLNPGREILTNNNHYNNIAFLS